LKGKKKKSARGQKPAQDLKRNAVNAAKLEQAAAALVEPVCNAAGLELVLAEFRRESAGRILRLYIDRPEDGVTLDDCAHISRQVTDLLDVSLEDIGPYNLEVSSPGSQRPLAKPSDYRRFNGQMARIQLQAPLNGQKNFKGIIIAANDETVEIETDRGPVALDFSQIARGRLSG
jgi:ribosome maturation factor RimP